MKNKYSEKEKNKQILLRENEWMNECKYRKVEERKWNEWMNESNYGKKK